MVGFRQFTIKQSQSVEMFRTYTIHLVQCQPQNGGAKTESGKTFQHNWLEKEARIHINQLELRAATLAILQLVRPRATVQLHIDTMTAIVYIRKMGGTCF